MIKMLESRVLGKTFRPKWGITGRGENAKLGTWLFVLVNRYFWRQSHDGGWRQKSLWHDKKNLYRIMMAKPEEKDYLEVLLIDWSIKIQKWSCVLKYLQNLYLCISNFHDACFIILFFHIYWSLNGLPWIFVNIVH